MLIYLSYQHIIEGKLKHNFEQIFYCLYLQVKLGQVNTFAYILNSIRMYNSLDCSYGRFDISFFNNLSTDLLLV